MTLLKISYGVIAELVKPLPVHDEMLLTELKPKKENKNKSPFSLEGEFSMKKIVNK